MPQEVINRVNELGVNDGQPELLIFYNRKGELIWGTNPRTDPTVPTIEATFEECTKNPGTEATIEATIGYGHTEPTIDSTFHPTKRDNDFGQT